MEKFFHAAGALLGSMLLIGQVHSADVFPSKAINLWVSWGAGSGTDISQRAIANLASKTLGQPIVVSSVTGGAGTLVLGRLKAEKPDGFILATAALTREESRGTHYREDFPDRNPAWNKRIVLSSGQNGEPKVEFLP